MNTLQANDIYIIPRSNQQGVLVYSPLRRLLFSATGRATEIIKQYAEDGIPIPVEETKLINHMSTMQNMIVEYPSEKSIGSISHAVILLSHKCNLACSYCYAQDARSSDTLSQEILMKIIGDLFTNAQNKVAFTFMGGGEPTFTWDLLKFGIKYIRA